MSLIKLKTKLESYRQKELFRKLLVRSAKKEEYFANFASNDYLGISEDDRVKEAIYEALYKYGFGSGSSALISGYYKPHQILEDKLAEFFGFEKAILFNSAYHANLGIISSLADRNSDVIADKLSHASIIDGILLSRAKFSRYEHLNLNQAEEILKNKSDESLLISETIFSMEGDICDGKKIVNIAKKYNSILLLDDSHGAGILGKKGKGIIEYSDINPSEIGCLIISFGKAFGAVGAIVLGNELMIDYFRQFARTYSYTSSLPPALVSGIIKASEILAKEDWRREKLQELIGYFNKTAKDCGLKLLSEQVTPIRSIIISDNKKLLEIQKILRDEQIIVSVIRHPTVAENKSRIRISLNIYNKEKDILNLIKIISKSI